MRENFDIKYSNEEIDRIIKEHEERIIDFCKELETYYADRGTFNTYESRRVLFDLRDGELIDQIIGQGISQELVDAIEEGFVIEVYNFKTGVLEEMAFENLEGEAAELYSMYMEEEISEEEYFDKYDEIIQPFIDRYIEDYLENAVSLNIDYLNALGKQENEYDSEIYY